MMDRDIKRKSTTRIPPRGGAIVYGIEGSKVVLAALERTKIEDDIAFLKPVADNATALLFTMRGIHDGEVDDEFAGLALDACGLAFILVSECYRFRRDHHDQVPDKLMWGSNELAEYLRDDIHSFVQKKIGRGFLKKHFMHATDDEKIGKFREKLRLWMGKLGIQTDLSIHEKVEAIISERLLTRNEEPEAPQRRPTSLNPEPIKQPEERFTEKPLPQIIVSDPRDMKDSEVDSNDNETPDAHPPAGEDQEDRKKKKKREEEQWKARKAERERWRRSEQEFCRLPLRETNTPAQTDGRTSRPASVASFASQAHSFESVQSSQAVAGLTSTSKNDEGTDRELALQLQAQLAKEIEEEDEKQALEIGIALHHQWEAEEKARSDKRHLESNGQLRTPDSMDSRSLKPQTKSGLSVTAYPEADQRLTGVQKSMPDDVNRSTSPIHLL